MPSYSLFGLGVESYRPIPGLSPLTSEHEASVVLRGPEVSDAPLSGLELLGSEEVAPCFIRLWRHDAGYRIEHACAGHYDVVGGGSEIICHLHDGATDATFRLDVLGRLLPLAMQARGWHCLHASAVSVDGNVIAFVAPKGTGKSSLALAMRAAGARIFADDALGIPPDDSLRVSPGVRSLRVNVDTSALIPELAWGAREAIDGKLVLEDTDAAAELEHDFELSAIYLVASTPADAPAPVLRERLGLQEALMVLVGQSKLGQLLGGSESVRHLDRSLALAMRVPVYRLSVARSLDRLPEAAATILGWHRSPTPTAR